MTVQEAIQILESHGWRPTKSEEGYRLFKHDSTPGIVTLSGNPDLEVPPGVLRSLFVHARIEGAG